MKRFCAQADAVIATAQVFGKKAPLIIKDDMIAAMKPGGVLVDLAVENGGNVEGSKAGEITQAHGATLVGFTPLAGRVPAHASQVYSANLRAFLLEFWDAENKTFHLDPEDDIIQGCLLTREGKIVRELGQDSSG